MDVKVDIIKRHKRLVTGKVGFKNPLHLDNEIVGHLSFIGWDEK